MDFPVWHPGNHPGSRGHETGGSRGSCAFRLMGRTTMVGLSDPRSAPRRADANRSNPGRPMVISTRVPALPWCRQSACQNSVSADFLLVDVDEPERHPLQEPVGRLGNDVNESPDL